VTRWFREVGGEAGDSMLQAVVIVALFLLVAVEAVIVVVGVVGLDRDAREIAREAASIHVSEGYLAPARAHAESEAEDRGAVVESISASQTSLTLTLERESSTLLVHRIGPIEHWATSTATTTTPLGR
jgi:hypothetical protein